MCNSEDDQLLEKYIKRRKAPHAPDDVRNVLDNLSAADTAHDLPSMLNYHLLGYDHSGLAAVDVKVLGTGGRGVWRMILRPISNCGDINREKSIEEIIIETLLENYHKGKV